jgi:sterol 3beta-glucosyltransferase
MRIAILTIGTRGDVQPHVALALGLRQAGHEVRFATYSNFQKFVTRYGLDFFALRGDSQALQSESTDWQAMLKSGSPLKAVNYFFRRATLLFASAQTDSWAACQEVDAIVYSSTALWGYDIAAKLGIPCYRTAAYPISPTRTFPAIGFPRLVGPLNWLSHLVLQEAVWQIFRRTIDKFRRQELGLTSAPPTSLHRRQDEQRVPFLYAYSPCVVPKPPDWPKRLHVTGFWFLDTPEWEPPRRLVDFLQAGPPPVCIGFSSMADLEASQTMQLVQEALRLSSQRGILVSGWSDLRDSNLSDDLFVLEEAPYDWLFPKMAAVVHHGGPGTTAYGLQAGLPSVAVPHFADQPFWAKRIVSLGVGPEPIPKRKLTAERLARAIIIAVNDRDMRKQAASLGKRIRAEDGVAQAVKIIHQYARDR